MEVIQMCRCQIRGVLSLSLSSGCDSGRTLIPLPSIPSWAPQPDRGLREYRCRIITGPLLYESMEHAANITPWNTPSQAAPSYLPITHCWAHARLKDVGWGSWEPKSTDWWENLWKECYYHCATLICINTPWSSVAHDLEAQMQKEWKLRC